MTKKLTKQWREGTLPEGCYYILDKNGHVKTERTCFYSYTDEQCFCFTSNKDIEEVIAPVPSHDEYKQLVSKNEQLEKRLENATKALKDIKVYSQRDWDEYNCMECAGKALKEMEGVK